MTVLFQKNTFDLVQAKLDGKAKPRLREDYNLDFPLRGYVLCDKCSKLLTASWSKGKLKRHPYYWCKNLKCSLVWKTIRQTDIHGRFENLLQITKPPKQLFELIKAIFLDVWRTKKRTCFN